MPMWLAALPLAFALDGDPGLHQRGVQGLQCSTRSDIECAQSTYQGGAGGAGGSASQPLTCYYCTITGPSGGSGGSGGGVSGSTAGKTVKSILPSCTLTIAGVKYVGAQHCLLDKASKQIVLSAPSLNQKYIYVISIDIMGWPAGHAHLSGGTSTNVRDLGLVKAIGSCWVTDNGEVSICGG